MFKPRWFVIHNTGGADNIGFDANGIRRILMARSLGGYHALRETIEGQFWTSMLNRFDRKAEHVRLHNSEALGFSFIADFNKVAPSDDLLRSAAPDVASLLRLLGMTPAALIAHRDVPDNNTDCPGKLLTPALFERLRTMVAEQYEAGLVSRVIGTLNGMPVEVTGEGNVELTATKVDVWYLLQDSSGRWGVDGSEWMGTSVKRATLRAVHALAVKAGLPGFAALPGEVGPKSAPCANCKRLERLIAAGVQENLLPSAALRREAARIAKRGRK